MVFLTISWNNTLHQDVLFKILTMYKIIKQCLHRKTLASKVHELGLKEEIVLLTNKLHVTYHE